MPTNPLDFQDARAEKTASIVEVMELQRLSTRLKPRLQVADGCVTRLQLSPDLKEVRVAMADMKVESKPVELVTSVGSCVALCLYDSADVGGGLAHIMLPNSAIAPQDSMPCKFADTAVPALANAVRKISGKDVCLHAKIAGGANIFSNLSNNGVPIGVKNVKAVKAALSANEIKLVAEDVGGSHGRRIAFNIGNGVATISRSNGEVKKL